MWRSRTRASRAASARRWGDAPSWAVARVRAERRVEGTAVSAQFPQLGWFSAISHGQPSARRASLGRCRRRYELVCGLDADDVAVGVGDGDHVDGAGLAFGVGGAGGGAFELDLLAGELGGGFVEVG